MNRDSGAEPINRPSVTTRYTHTRTEDADTVTIVWNTWYTYMMYLFIVLVIAGWYLGGLFLILAAAGAAGLIVQLVYSLKYYSGAFLEIDKANKEKRVEITGNKNTPHAPLTHVISKHSKGNAKRKSSK